MPRGLDSSCSDTTGALSNTMDHAFEIFDTGPRKGQMIDLFHQMEMVLQRDNTIEISFDR